MKNASNFNPGIAMVFLHHFQANHLKISSFHKIGNKMSSGTLHHESISFSNLGRKCSTKISTVKYFGAFSELMEI